MDTVQNTFICPHNEGIECSNPECERCGWYPPVEAARKEATVRKLRELSEMKHYKVPFTGYFEVDAKDPEHALDVADNGDAYFAEYKFGDPICLDEEEEDELD